MSIIRKYSEVLGSYMSEPKRNNIMDYGLSNESVLVDSLPNFSSFHTKYYLPSIPLYHNHRGKLLEYLCKL
jgi:hypothetical protein